MSLLLLTLAGAQAATPRAEVARPTDFDPVAPGTTVLHCKSGSLLGCGRQASSRMALPRGSGKKADYRFVEEDFMFDSGVGIFLQTAVARDKARHMEWRRRMAFRKLPEGGFQLLQVSLQYRCQGDEWLKRACVPRASQQAAKAKARAAAVSAAARQRPLAGDGEGGRGGSTGSAEPVGSIDDTISQAQARDSALRQAEAREAGQAARAAVASAGEASDAAAASQPRAVRPEGDQDGQSAAAAAEASLSGAEDSDASASSAAQAAGADGTKDDLPAPGSAGQSHNSGAAGSGEGSSLPLPGGLAPVPVPTSPASVRDAKGFSPLVLSTENVVQLSRPCEQPIDLCGQQAFDIVFPPESYAELAPSQVRRESFIYVDNPVTSAVYLVTMMNLPDDALAAERVRIEFVRRGAAWVAVSVARQQRCRRSGGEGGTADWTDQVCP